MAVKKAAKKSATPKDVLTDRLLPISQVGRYTGVLDLLSRTVPGYFLQEVRATSSTASAYGYLYTLATCYWDLLDEMLDRDPKISSCVSMIVCRILERRRGCSVPEEFEGDPQALAAAALVDRVFESLEFERLLWVLVYGTLVHGLSAVELQWTVAPDNTVTPTKFYHCHPGQFTFGRDGEPYMVADDMTPRPLPTNKFMLMRAPGPYDNPYGTSSIFGLRWLWYLKKGCVRSMARYAGKFGLPLLHGTLPSSQSTNKALQDALAEKLAAMAEDDALVTTNGESIQVIDRAGGVGVPPHERLLDYCDEQITQRLLGSTLATNEAEYGSRAQATVHERTMDSQTLSLARTLVQIINTQLIQPLVAYNLGEACPCPEFWIDVDATREGKEIRESLQLAADLGIEVAVSEAREMLGFRVPKPGEEVIQPKALPGVAVPEPDEDDDEDPLVYATKADMFGQVARWFVATAGGVTKAFAGTGDSPVAFRQQYALAAVDREASWRRRLDRVAEDSSTEADAVLTEANALFVAALRKAASENPDGLVQDSLARSTDGGFVGSVALVERALWASFILSTLATASHKEALTALSASGWVTRFAAEDVESWLLKTPAGFEQAVKWMLGRKVMLKADLERLARVYAASKGVSLEAAGRIIRDKAIALARSSAATATEKLRNFIAKAVESGTSNKTFLAIVDKLDKQGLLPGGTDSYWENVFRTETASAYSAQQKVEEAGLGNNLWGHEAMNPQDDRSRDSHANMNGLLFKEGSAASQALGWPPWSYQCRCALVPIIVPDAQTAAYEESPGALAAALSVERFNS